MSANHSPLGKARLIVVICCLILIVGIVGYAFLNDANTSVVEKEKIQANIARYENQDFGYTYISSYVKKYGIGNLNSYKLNYVEDKLETDFYKELPSEYDLAKNICELYLEYFYDSTDGQDKDAVTDAVINCLFESLGDPYAYYRNVEEFQSYIDSLQGDESFVGIGVMVDATTLEVLTVYKDSAAEAAGIRRGDFIYGVEGKTIEDTSPDELTQMLRGEIGTEVHITLKRGDELIEVVAVRMQLSERTVTYELDSDKVGYIYVTQFLATTYQQFTEAVDYCLENNAVALVIDMRYNPGGLLDTVVDMIDYIVPDEKNRMISTYTQGDIKYTDYTEDGHGINIPIAVICNEGTASAGELFTAAMRDFDDANVIDAVIVGTNTYGKGVVQTSYPLYDMSGITYTIGYYNPPCDVNFDGIGITPDVEVEEIQGTDAPFNTAKEEVLKLVYTNSGTVSIPAKAA